MNIKTPIIPILLLLISGCGKDKSVEYDAADPYIFPEVNDENCKGTNIGEVPEEFRDRFTTLCVRRSDSKKSEQKEW